MSDFEYTAIPPSDVSAAEWDLRNLTCQQLLYIRNQTLDLVTEGKANFTAHNSFIMKVETYLFELIGRILLNEQEKTPAKKLQLQSFGSSVAIVLGAIRMMSEQHDPEENLPNVWVFMLDGQYWLGRAAILHLEELLA